MNHPLDGLLARLRTHLNVRVEITLALQVVANIPPALLQQVIVHRALGEDREQLPLFALAQARAGDLDAHPRTGLRGKLQRHAIGLRVIRLHRNQSTRAQITLIDEEFPQLVRTAR